MSNSNLVQYTQFSPNKSSRNGEKIDKITVHHMAGILSVETCGGIFASPARQASSNYGIGMDARVALYVDESERAWTSSNAANDRRAVTIEVSNSSVGGNWPVSEACWNKLVDLCVDICQRNGIPQLNYTGDPNGNLTNHDMFAATTCCGPYLKSRMFDLASQVNARLNGGSAPAPAPSNPPQSSGETAENFGGTYRCTVPALNVRDAPSLSGNVVASYGNGQTVILDNWYKIADGYVWGRYTGSSSGKLRYIAVGKATGKPEPDDYLIKVS